MKRYKVLDSVMDIKLYEDGEWVRYEDVENLEIAYEKLKKALVLIVQDLGEDK